MYQLGIGEGWVNLDGTIFALFGLVDNCVACALILCGVCDIDDLMDSRGAWALEQSTVACIWRGGRGCWQEVWLETSAIVVPVLGVNLHWLYVECVGRVDELRKPFGIPMVRLPTGAINQTNSTEK